MGNRKQEFLASQTINKKPVFLSRRFYERQNPRLAESTCFDAARSSSLPHGPKRGIRPKEIEKQMNSVRRYGMKPESLERLQVRAKIDSLFLQIELFPDIVPMGPDRAGRRVEHIGNFFGPLASADQIGDLNFLGGQALV